MTEQISIFGYYDDEAQERPTYDPKLSALCPHCLTQLALPVRTTSLMIPGDERSFFYRSHKACDEGATPAAIEQIEGALIDSRTPMAAPTSP